MFSATRGIEGFLILMLLVLSAGVFFYVGSKGDRLFGDFAKNENLVSRFPEKQPLGYDASHLRTLKEKYRAVATQYVSPILFPYDLAFMLIAGGSMLLAACHFGRLAGAPVSCPWLYWVALVLPVVYVAVDLIEDSLIALMLKGAVDISAGSVGVLKSLTFAKMFSFGGAIGTTLILTGWGLFAPIPAASTS